jgi:hypothetical protein
LRDRGLWLKNNIPGESYRSTGNIALLGKGQTAFRFILEAIQELLKKINLTDMHVLMKLERQTPETRAA